MLCSSPSLDPILPTGSEIRPKGGEAPAFSPLGNARLLPLSASIEF
jgi:hypothetical protein